MILQKVLKYTLKKVIMRMLLLSILFLIQTQAKAPVFPKYVLDAKFQTHIDRINIEEMQLSPVVEFSYEFKKAILEMCDTLNIKVPHLMTVFHVETIGSFKPDKKSPIGAVGLVQFTSSTAKWLKTDVYSLSKMTRTQQLKYVARYFYGVKKYYGELVSLEDVFMAVHYPKAIKKGLYSTVYKEGSKAYKNNRFNDRNKDGKVTKYEISNFVRSIYKKYYEV